MLAQLERAQPRFRATGVRALAVTMAAPEETAAFCGRRAPGVTCLSDPTRTAYTAYGLRRGSVPEVMGFAAVISGARAAAGGHMQGRIVGDPMMMPGTFAIDRDGIVRAVHYARHSGDQPDLDAMIASLTRSGAPRRG